MKIIEKFYLAVSLLLLMPNMSGCKSDGEDNLLLLLGAFTLMGNQQNTGNNSSGIQPDPVSGVTATAGMSNVTLSWTLPATTIEGVVVIRNSIASPVDLSDGVVVCDGLDSSCVDSSPEQCSISYYSVFTYDSAGNISSGVSVSADPLDCFSQQAYLKASNAEAYDWFGESVAISGDTIVVGARFEDSNQATITNGTGASADNSASGAGAAYVYVRGVSGWSQQAYLKAPNADESDWFGEKVAISGDTIVVSAQNESSNQTTITNGATASADNSAYASGSAYVFVRSGSTWSHEAYLKAPNAEASDRFGIAVAISGDTIVVGAQAEDSNQTNVTNGTGASADNSASGAGAAYVFVRSGATWSQQAYLKASNAEAYDVFGGAVAVSGDTIVVGAQQESSSQTTITNGATASADNSASSSGAVYVFARSGSIWSQQAYLKAPNADPIDWFGQSVAISGDTIVVGTEKEKSSQTFITNGATASMDNSASGAGAAYVFVRSGSTWSQQAYLKASNAEASDFFGNTVAISGDTIVVGAYCEDSNQATIENGSIASADNSASNSGVSYVYIRSGNTWSQQAYLKASNAESGDVFGHAVAISGDTIVIGASGEESNQTAVTNGNTASTDNSAIAPGAAYVFVRE